MKTGVSSVLKGRHTIATKASLLVLVGEDVGDVGVEPAERLKLGTDEVVNRRGGLRGTGKAAAGVDSLLEESVIVTKGLKAVVLVGVGWLAHHAESGRSLDVAVAVGAKVLVDCARALEGRGGLELGHARRLGAAQGETRAPRMENV